MFSNRRNALLTKVKNIASEDFAAVAMAVFEFQYEYNAIYRQFIDFLNVDVKKISHLEQIPFLPIQFFKQYDIKTGDWESEIVFSSSGTTGQITSKHHVKNIDFYLDNTFVGFEKFYGKVEEYCILALLPSYLEREGSSLVAMTDAFIKKSKHKNSGFFLHNHNDLILALKENIAANIPTLLIGVSYALLDLAERNEIDLAKVIVMETGGMKGKRKEITRNELHETLNKKLNTQVIHSEYGMTELLSQGYSKGNGIFEACDTLKIITKEINDPFASQAFGKNGIINIIDLANVDSCAFIATEDVGVVFADGRFEIKGRLDTSEMRGCNLMVE
jgi:hypothetical protein